MPIDIGTDPTVTPTQAQLAAAAEAFATVRVTGFSTAKAKLLAGQPITILIDADSTWNADASPREPAYLFADALAARYPTSAVSLVPWNTGTALFDAPVVVSAGSGGPAITIVNFAVPGAQLQYGLATFFNRALRLWTPDAVIVAHGLNHVTGVTQPMVTGELFSGQETLRQAFPGTGIVFIKENPFRDNTTMNFAVQALDIISGATDTSIVNFHDVVTAAGKPTGWYEDNTHLNQTGVDAVFPKLTEHWDITVPVMTRFARSTLGDVVPYDQNLIVNGNFEKWTTSPGVPDGWTAGGAGTLVASKETTIIANNRKGYSAKLLGTGNTSHIYQDVVAGILSYVRGKTVSLCVKLNKDASASGSVGRIFVQAGSPALGTQTETTRSYITNQNGWMYWAICGFAVPADASFLRVGLYHDSAASPSVSPAFYDSCALVPGVAPRIAA